MRSPQFKAAQRLATRACLADLRASGVDLVPPGAVAAFVREHLDYFQLMIAGDRGVECSARRVGSLLRAELGAAALGPHRVH